MTDTIAIVTGRSVIGTPSGTILVNLITARLRGRNDVVYEATEDHPLGPAVGFYVAWKSDPVIIRENAKTVFMFGAKAQKWVAYTVRPMARFHTYPDLGFLAARGNTRNYQAKWYKLLETLETLVTKEYSNVREI